jgi:hypothetical protein
VREAVIREIHRAYTESTEINQGTIFECEFLCDTPEEEISVVTINDEKVTCKRCLKIMREKG